MITIFRLQLLSAREVLVEHDMLHIYTVYYSCMVCEFEALAIENVLCYAGIHAIPIIHRCHNNTSVYIFPVAKSIDNNSTQQGAEVTGLSAALGVLVACVIAAVIMGLIVFRRRNIHMDLRRKNTSSATETPNSMCSNLR